MPRRIAKGFRRLQTDKHLPVLRAAQVMAASVRAPTALHTGDVELGEQASLRRHGRVQLRWLTYWINVTTSFTPTSSELGRERHGPHGSPTHAEAGR
jgi:hypothetical protein